MLSSSDWSEGGGGIALGECVFLQDSTQPLIVIDNMSFLQSGSLLIDAANDYPDAFANFAVDRPLDYKTWALYPDGTPVAFENLYFLNGLYIGHSHVGTESNHDKIFFSADGKNWTVVTPGFKTIHGLAYIAGVYAIAGYNDTYDTITLAWSTNLVNWTFVTDASANINGYFEVQQIGSYICAFGAYDATYNPSNLATSTDGKTWTRRAVTNLRFNIYFSWVAGTTCIVMGSDSAGVVKAATSTNGTTWTANTALPTLAGIYNYINAVAFGLGLFVIASAASIYTTTAIASTPTLRYTDPDGNGITDLIFDGTQFWASTGTWLLKSLDGISWTRMFNGTGFKAIMSNATDALRLFVASNSSYRPAPLKSVGVMQHITDGSTPLYMRVK